MTTYFSDLWFMKLNETDVKSWPQEFIQIFTHLQHALEEASGGSGAHVLHEDGQNNSRYSGEYSGRQFFSTCSVEYISVLFNSEGLLF